MMLLLHIVYWSCHIREVSFVICLQHSMHRDSGGNSTSAYEEGRWWGASSGYYAQRQWRKMDQCLDLSSRIPIICL